MAITKFEYLDQVGAQALATYLLRAGNTRIKERIATAIAEATYSDDNHVLSAKAILDLIGKIDNYASMTGEEGTVLAKIKALDLEVGEKTDTSDKETVYGAIQGVRELISGLTHLTYQVVTGDIATQVPLADVKEDVIYLQHDAPSYSVGNDGYLLDADGAHAKANDGTNDYEAWVDTDGKIYKMVAGVKGAELSADDAIFANVALVEDKTYTLYIGQLEYTDETKTTRKSVTWIAVGDTSLDLDNYWSKKDSDVAALRDLMLDELTDAQIETAVKAAWAATDPYQSSNAYVEW